jgi:hypothetical protein
LTECCLGIAIARRATGRKHREYGVECVDRAITEDLDGVNQETLAKVLGVIRFVARRRTRLGREYMQVIHQFVGLAVVPGIRALVL